MVRYEIRGTLFYKIDDFKKFFTEQAAMYDKTIHFQLPVYVFEKVSYIKCSIADRLVQQALSQLTQSIVPDTIEIDQAYTSMDEIDVTNKLNDLYESMSIVWSQYILLGEKLESLNIRSQNNFAIKTAKECFDDRHFTATIHPEEHMKLTKATKDDIFNEYASLAPTVDAVLAELAIAERLADRLKNLEETDGMDEEGFVFVNAVVDQIDVIREKFNYIPKSILLNLEVEDEGEDLYA